jgi:hypothetical protein
LDGGSTRRLKVVDRKAAPAVVFFEAEQKPALANISRFSQSSLPATANLWLAERWDICFQR